MRLILNIRIIIIRKSLSVWIMEINKAQNILQRELFCGSAIGKESEIHAEPGAMIGRGKLAMG